MRASPPAAFRIEIQPARDRVLVAAHGELDIATAPELADELDALVDRGFHTIVVDLRPTTFIDSSGVHLLVRHTARPDATISVISGPRSVTRVLDIAGALEVLRLERAP
jgi:anti-sigma B factor antagonist